MGDVTFINTVAEKLVELLQSGLGKVPGLAGTDVTLQSPTVLLSSRSNAPLCFRYSSTARKSMLHLESHHQGRGRPDSERVHR